MNSVQGGICSFVWKDESTVYREQYYQYKNDTSGIIVRGSKDSIC